MLSAVVRWQRPLSCTYDQSMRRGKLLKVRNNEKLSFQRLHCNQLEGRKHSLWPLWPFTIHGRFPQLLWLFSTLQATDPLRRDR